MATSTSWSERDRQVVWHPYAAMPGPSAYTVVSAEGVRLRLGDGRDVIDGMSSWWAAIHGYRHPVLDEAVRRQLDEVAHVMFGGLTHPRAIELAERLIAIAPRPLAHVFFADSGSVAIEVAIKMVLQYWMGVGRPGKHRLLTVRGGYHGDTFAAMSVCDPVTGMHHLFRSAMPEQLFADYPAPAFSEPFAETHIASVVSLLAAHADEVAAVVIEPIVQGAGGMRFYSPDYLRRLRALCDEHEVLLIVDEIATGFGRTGEIFASDHAVIAPDVMCVGKAMTGGYLSMAATLCTTEVAGGVSRAEPGALMHGPTFMGNPLAAAVSLASIDLLLSQPWQTEIRRIEQGLIDGLAPARSLPGVVDVRVLGAIGVIETRHALDIDAVQALLVDRGVWLRPFGRLLYTMPPFIIDDDSLAVVTSAMTESAARF
ncbi:MAG TPA: adenosylmethionine--8-amino-7-oxononanoate transaminase [Acidimicrobiales bacterium]|nr:adenosylmethionine--8-amino-7-oxononanoate transaminase [Acidimicrobiales bacterium]